MANTKNFIAKNGFSTGDGYSMPDVRPELLFDFQNSKTLDPRITFTRGSTATYWDGKTTHKAEENLTQYSNNFANAYWTKEQVTVTEGATAPDGSATAATVQATINGDPTQAVYHLMDPVPQIGASVSIYAKEGTTEFFALQAGTSNPNALFNLNTGAVLASTGCTATITSVGNGWYRCALENITTTAGNYIMMSPVGSDIGTGDAWGNNDAQAGDNVLIWGVQLENNSSPTAYTATGGSPILKFQPTLRTAASGEARFDHNPITKESLGLLMETSRTNLFPQSANDTNFTYTNEVTLTDDFAIAPDGTQNAFIAQASTTSAQHYFGIPQGWGSSSGSDTFSIHLKSYGVPNVTLILANQSGAYSLVVDLDAGTITTSGSANVNESMEDVGNGWYRISMSWTATKSTPYPTIRLLDSSDASTWAGDGFSGVLVWGAQWEAGSFPTSYIPTSGSTVTRPRDAASVANSDLPLNTEQGTMTTNALIDGEKSNASFTSGIGVSSGKYLGLLYSNSYSGYFQPSHGSIVAGSGGPSLSSGLTVRKAAMSWSGTSPGFIARYAQSGLSNGETGIASEVSFLAAYAGNPALYMTIGRAAFDTGSEYARNCWIQQVALYSKVFSNETLAMLTEE